MRGPWPQARQEGEPPRAAVPVGSCVSSPRCLPAPRTSWSWPVDRLLCRSLVGRRARDMLSPGGLEEAEALEAGDRTGLHVLGPAPETPCAMVSSSVKWGHQGVRGQTRPCP